MEAKPPYPTKNSAVTGSTVLLLHLHGEGIPLHQPKVLNRDMNIQTKWKSSQCWCPIHL